jgi:hypothetical protein
MRNSRGVVRQHIPVTECVGQSCLLLPSNPSHLSPLAPRTSFATRHSFAHLFAVSLKLCASTMSGSHYPPSDATRPNMYQSSQPQFVQSHPNFAPRDRYRSMNLDHDAVEDDYPNHLDMPLDEFDQRLLEQPYEDRQRAAERGRARLSLAPGPSRFFGAIEPEMNRYGMNLSHERGMEFHQPSIGARLC